MKPLVSILVPVFNHSEYIEECLDSILNLDYPNVELVLCDDGSKDDSYAKVKSWLARNQSVRAKLLTQKNQGVCKTLNRLIKESSGEYISICASDDLLTSNCFTERVKLLEQNSAKLACIGDATLINENSQKIAESAMKTLYGSDFKCLQLDIVTELVLRWSIVGPSLLINRQAYDKYGFYDESFLIEDREFYLRLLADNVLIFIPDVVSKYRIHESNISRKSISSRLVVLEQVALSNLKHSNSFSGFNKLFLLSHKVDLFLLNFTSFNFRYYVLQAFRTIRKSIVTVVRFFIQA